MTINEKLGFIDWSKDCEVIKKSGLFSRWYDHIMEKKAYSCGYVNFVCDGIFNNTPDACEKWEQAPRKIVFLLKDNPDSMGDTRGWIEQDRVADDIVEKNLFIKNLAHAFYALSFDVFDFDSIQIEDVKTHAMRSPWALIECKKESGNKSISQKVLREHINRDKEFLLEEFEILHPNIYVCCTGTMDIVRQKYADGLVTNIEGIDSKYNVAYHPETNTLILMCYHPSHRPCRYSPRYYVNNIMKHYGQFLRTPYGQELLSKL